MIVSISNRYQILLVQILGNFYFVGSEENPKRNGLIPVGETTSEKFLNATNFMKFLRILKITCLLIGVPRRAAKNRFQKMYIGNWNTEFWAI